MKIRNFVSLFVCIFSASAFSQDSSCQLMRDVGRTHLTQQHSKIKDRIARDRDAILSSPTMLDAIQNNRYTGSFNRWFPGDREQNGMKTSLNLYVAGDLYPANTLVAWSGNEEWGQDKSQDVSELAAHINSIRKANGLGSIAIGGITYQQDRTNNGPLKLDEIQIVEGNDGRTVKSVEELTDRYMLPEFCVRRYVYNLSVNDISRGNSNLEDRGAVNQQQSLSGSAVSAQ